MLELLLFGIFRHAGNHKFNSGNPKIVLAIFSRRFSREKCPTLTVASFFSFFLSDYNLTLAYNFRRQNSEPTRVTPTSSTCLDHYITSYQTVHQSEKTTMSDHYTVLGEIPDVKYEVTAESHCKIRTTNLKNIKGDNALKFLFILEQRLMKLDENNLNYTEQISKCILECIERFALVTEIKTKENPTDWITNCGNPPPRSLLLILLFRLGSVHFDKVV